MWIYLFSIEAKSIVKKNTTYNENELISATASFSIFETNELVDFMFRHRWNEVQITWMVLIYVQDTRSVSETDWRKEKHRKNNTSHGKKIEKTDARDIVRRQRKYFASFRTGNMIFVFLNTNIDSERKSSIFIESFFVRWTGISSREIAYFVSHTSGILLLLFYICRKRWKWNKNCVIHRVRNCPPNHPSHHATVSVYNNINIKKRKKNVSANVTSSHCRHLVDFR